jgi:hypothetical protein
MLFLSLSKNIVTTLPKEISKIYLENLVRLHNKKLVVEVDTGGFLGIAVSIREKYYFAWQAHSFGVQLLNLPSSSTLLLESWYVPLPKDIQINLIGVEIGY